MLKKLLVLLLCVSFLLVTASCNNGASGTDTTTGGETEASTGDGVTTDAGTQGGVDEEERYFYNPRIENAYRKNDNTVLFTVDTSMKDPDGNLYEHIYVAATADGEPIARATSADAYEPKNGMTKIWGANFDVTLPEKVFLCFEELDGEGNGDADLSTVLCDVVQLGIYGETTLASGKRIAAIETGDVVIEANKWVSYPLADATFVSPAGNEIQRDQIIENTVLCTVVRDPDGYCEFTYTGSGLRLEMLCNVQGDTCYNVPALKMYLDGEEYTTISMTDPTKYTWDNNSDIVFEDMTIPHGTHTVRFVNTTEGSFNSENAYYCGIYYVP